LFYIVFMSAARRIATMVANWVRVGFAQGNFNADNCLVGGKTMDYGPFGWLEEFTDLFAKWTGSGQHFGFLNQPAAGFANFQVLAESVAPVIMAATDPGNNPDELIEKIMEEAQVVFRLKVDEVFRTKLGLDKDADVGDDLWEGLKPLLRKSRVDWTLFWRQLTYVAQTFSDLESTDYEDMMKTLEGQGEASPFYEPLSPEVRQEWLAWIEQWRDVLQGIEATNAYETMRTANPKFVLREWMLVDAYSLAAEGDDSILKELFELIQHPYEEGTPREIEEYYRRAPARALTTGGTAFMS
jgi:uncharacterized protein YdiU (UPF0061 family)